MAEPGQPDESGLDQSGLDESGLDQSGQPVPVLAVVGRPNVG